MMSNGPHWIGDELHTFWYGATRPDYVGTLRPNRDPRKRQRFVFTADTVDDRFVKFYYERPTAGEVMAAFLAWQERGQ